MDNNPHQKSKSAYVCHYIMKHLDITANLLHDNLSCWYICMNEHEVYIKSCVTQCTKHELETKCKTIVQRCADSINQTIDIYNIWKLHKLYEVREYCLQK